MRLAALLPFVMLLGYAASLSLGARGADPGAAIGSISLDALCAAIRSGAPVTFVDVREPAEFAEEHLPRAILLPARDMEQKAAASLRRDATIVPYCLKDFRGFEGAKRLRGLGFEDVRLLEGVGINGWKAHGLPTAGPLPARSEDDAWRALIARCEEAS